MRWAAWFLWVAVVAVVGAAGQGLTGAQATEFDLRRFFEGNGEPIALYDAAIMELTPGDVVRLDDGIRRFKVGGIHQDGMKTLVLDLCAPEATGVDCAPFAVLRMPKERTEREFMRKTKAGYKALMRGGVPVPQPYWVWQPGYVIVAEHVPHQYTLLSAIKNRGSIPDRQWLRMLSKLSAFMDKTEAFSKLGDLHAGQLVFATSERRGGWMLLDWTDAHLLAQPGEITRTAASQLSTWLTSANAMGGHGLARAHSDALSDVLDVLSDAHRRIVLRRNQPGFPFLDSKCLGRVTPLSYLDEIPTH